MSRLIVLSGGKSALVDDCDFPALCGFRWHAFKNGRAWYAARTDRSGGRKRTIYMHRQILGVSGSEHVDHVDGDGLNNTRENIRLCTRQQNHWNVRSFRGSSKFKGVAFHKKSRRWQAYISFNDSQIHIGLFGSELAAASAYDAKAIQLFGRFAKPNFPNALERELAKAQGRRELERLRA